MINEEKARQEYNQMRNDDWVFAQLWRESDYDFYEWCSNYEDLKHIKGVCDD